MPTLHWIGKEKVINHHRDVPYRVLEHQYGFDGEQGEVNEPTNSGNKIIHGDNLEALKSLLPEYEGKIKCIYIDPPYNTGNESWVYNDNVNHPKLKKWLGEIVGKEGDDLSRHDKWLCMITPRLKLLHRLLANDGAIFISLDDNEVHHMRILCEEIFGKNNLVAQLTLLCNPKGRSQDKYFATNHEYCLVFSKNRLPKGSFDVLKEDAEIEGDYPKIDKNGRYREIELRNTHREFNRETRNNLFYPLYINPLTNLVSTVKSHEYNIECYPLWPDGFEGCWTWGIEKVKDEAELLFSKVVDGNYKIYRKNYAFEGNKGPSKKLFSIINNPLFYTEKGQKLFGEIFPGLNKNDFPQPKSVDYVARLIETVTEKDSIVLDSFAGSGTTGEAVLRLNKKDSGNRKFILIEMEDYAEKITSERLKKVIQGYDYTGIEKINLKQYSINITNLKKAEKIIANYESYRNNREYDDVKIKLIDDKITIEGIKRINSKKEGLGGSFDYIELGKFLFNSNDLLNEEVEEEKIREYVWYSETKSAYTKDSGHKHLLGTKDGNSYYFYYEKEALTTLNHEFLNTITNKAEQYVIYADNCLLAKKFMQEHSIVFKKIPRDISRF